MLHNGLPSPASPFNFLVSPYQKQEEIPRMHLLASKLDDLILLNATAM